MKHEWIGPMCVRCGLTRGRSARAYADTGSYPSCEPGPTPRCSHPLAARIIVQDDSTIPVGLKTDCWACAIQREVVSKIVGPAAKKQRGGA